MIMPTLERDVIIYVKCTIQQCIFMNTHSQIGRWMQIVDNRT